MSKEKTAVEFYDQQLHILDLRLKSGSITIGEYFTLKAELFAQAKQMEKEHLECAFLDGYGNGHSNGVMYDIDDDLHEIKLSDPKQYYESKYGKDENTQI